MTAIAEGQRTWRLGAALEIATSCVVALAYFATCYLIKISPTERMGQVSILAALAYHFLWFAIPLVVSLIVVARYRPAQWGLAVRLVCAAFAGLSTAMVAGGVLCMLRGTPYGLAADTGDSAVLASWARGLQLGAETPGLYPPLQIHLLAWIADIQHVPTTYAIKYFQLIGILAFGPAGYAAWRLLLRPTWALAIGVVAALPIHDVYRPYTFLVLVVFLPLVLAFLETLRGAAERPVRALAICGAAYGVGLGLLFLLYSGWFQWSAPGFFIAMLVVFPWRAGARRGAVLCGAALLAFLAIAGYSLARILAEPPIADYFYYFDAAVDPAYIAMWRGALPGVLENFWPPIGELGGVGLFTVALCVGWGASIVLGARRTVVMATSWIMVGTWLLRFHYARGMWQTKMVQLYPRTTAELLYCLLILTGIGGLLYIDRKRAAAPETSPLRTPWGVVGALCGMSLLFVSSGTAITDRYMPRESASDYGHLAHLAHTRPRQAPNLAWGSVVQVASAVDPAAPVALVDQETTTVYKSALSATADHEEWITVMFPGIRAVSRVVLVPTAEGFPVDFTIDVWDGKEWATRIARAGYQVTPGPQTFSWGPRLRTSKVRLHVTKLGPAGGQFGLYLGELGAYR